MAEKMNLQILRKDSTIHIGRAIISLPRTCTPSSLYEWAEHMPPSRLSRCLGTEDNHDGTVTVYERSKGVGHYRISRIDCKTGATAEETSGTDCYCLFGEGETIKQLKRIKGAFKFN